VQAAAWLVCALSTACTFLSVAPEFDLEAFNTGDYVQVRMQHIYIIDNYQALSVSYDGCELLYLLGAAVKLMCCCMSSFAHVHELHNHCFGQAAVCTCSKLLHVHSCCCMCTLV
jgi:hypothetical protein